MKKTTIMLVTVLFMIIGYAAYNATVNIYGLGKISENISDFKVYLNNLKVNDKENTGINDVKDEFTIDNVNGKISVDIVNDSTEYDTESYLECESNVTLDKTEWTFDYTGSEQTFTAPMSATYKLETWGAQGGGHIAVGGYGGYSNGNVILKNNTKLFINVGESGVSSSDSDLSYTYNGGGNSHYQGGMANNRYFSNGGGATHIATLSGLLSTLESNQADILIVSGAGGGAYYGSQEIQNGGSGGGYIGNNGSQTTQGWGSFGYAGSQNEGGYSLCDDITCSANDFERGKYSIGSFGHGGGTSVNHPIPSSGGGSGYYGGGGSTHVQSGGGGSGYIGNSLLTEKSMYCYNCTESTEESTRTISTTCTSETPTENCAKTGNGCARITFLSGKFNTQKETIEAQDSKIIKLENINTSNLTCKLRISKISRATKIPKYDGPTEWTFAYTGSEQIFTSPVRGTYKLETWGASGGNSLTYIGGYGAYSIGEIKLYKKEQIFINVGGTGKSCSTASCEVVGGYNGGGSCKTLTFEQSGDTNSSCSSGGGATHIATKSGLLATLENNKSAILIVSGGGGGSNYCNRWNYANGGHGGGINGVSSINAGAPDFSSNGGLLATGGTQLDGNKFGQGSEVNSSHTANVGGGGGYYGGKGSGFNGGAGGSGYIGNSKLFEKSMYCYNCTESSEEATKTISTTCTNETPTKNCAKQGNGYARITLISQN